MNEEEVTNDGDNTSSEENREQGAPDVGRGSFPDGSDRGEVLPPDAGDASRPEVIRPESGDDAGDSDVPSIASIQQTLAFIQENHLHLPLLIPDPETLNTLRESAPELYQSYLKAIDAEIATSSTERLKRFEVPEFYARRGQILGFVICLAVLSLAGFAMFKDMEVLAGTIAAIDVIALAAVFGANQKPKER
ncbi:MAG: hypothetical protein MSC45_03195 [Mobiluncus sp.]|uniref:hypothetical protein n=1 Tax=Mobiluncus sp. TaxID=47293 RepID=UPI002586745E|nr:hypothetical protein [Mobiluncus sp.]MCI6584063.1 hypothetical protein [Mobiluncus sp.]